MTNNKNYYTSSNYATTIPTREEFHRYTSNLLTEWDFCTDFPPALAHGQADRVASAMRWTQANAVGRTYNYKFKR